MTSVGVTASPLADNNPEAGPSTGCFKVLDES